MAGTINKVILIGRLGADPDVRYTSDGSPVVNFNMATNEAVRVGDNWEERPEWHRVVAFGKIAERCGTYLNKGKLVYVEGRLRTRQWEDGQGVKRYTTEIVARDVQMLGGAQGDRPMQEGRPPEGARSQPSQGHAGGGRSLSEELPPMPSGPEDDIPF